jgi:hypothetical protein
MSRACVVVLALIALAACNQQPAGQPKQTAPEAVTPFDLNIEIGRYGVMLQQVGNITTEVPNAAELEPEAPRAMARSLRETVWEYNLARSRLCARGLYMEASCGPAYEPVWISDPATAEPALEELKARADALGAEVQPFWNVVCEDIRARTTDEQEKMYVCAIE